MRVKIPFSKPKSDEKMSNVGVPKGTSNWVGKSRPINAGPNRYLQAYGILYLVRYTAKGTSEWNAKHSEKTHTYMYTCVYTHARTPTHPYTIKKKEATFGRKCEA